MYCIYLYAYVCDILIEPPLNVHTNERTQHRIANHLYVENSNDGMPLGFTICIPHFHEIKYFQ